MAYTLIAHTAAGSSDGGNSVTTSNIDTTGATLLLAFTAAYIAAPFPTIGENKGNPAWAPLTVYNDGSTGVQVRVDYIKNPSSVGSGHNASATQSGSFPTIAFAAFSGADTSSPFDQQNGAGQSTNATSFQPGSITPSVDNEVLWAGIGLDGSYSSPAVDSSFTLLDSVAYNAGQCFGIAVAYQIQTTATARNPTFSWTTNVPRMAASIASFKAAGGGGGTDQPIEKRHGGVPFMSAMQLRGGVRGGVW